MITAELIAVVIILGIFFFGRSCDQEVMYSNFISEHTTTPYCLESKAVVAEKSITLKRCWKVIEVEP